MKMLLINQCTDSSMWYAGKVGQTVKYTKGPDQWGFYTSIDDGGYINIVREEDCTLVDVINAEELKR